MTSYAVSLVQPEVLWNATSRMSTNGEERHAMHSASINRMVGTMDPVTDLRALPPWPSFRFFLALGTPTAGASCSGAGTSSGVAASTFMTMSASGTEGLLGEFACAGVAPE